MTGELKDYDFDLPREQIAQYPIENRIDARLMRLDRLHGQISHHHIRSLGDLIEPGDALVFNDTKVIPARLDGFRTKTGGHWEGLFLGVDAEQPGLWEVLSKTRGRLEIGETVTLKDRQAREGIRLELVARLGEGKLAVRPLPAGNTFEILERFGRVPLPPYIRDGRMVDADLQTYQTTYAKHPGSVAAPTAGLHFTKELLRQLEASGIILAAVTLHVGIGTFRPIKTENLSEHQMHSEWGSIDERNVSKLQGVKAKGGKIIAVGTTTVRVLETAAASGVLAPWTGQTNLFIRPGYTFKAIDGLLTNFHLPRSSLLVLVSAFAGRESTLNAYRTAVREGYRFFSYGDAMLIT